MRRGSKYRWIIGFFGFFGLAGINGEPQALLCLALLGGFNSYWWHKLGDEEDERLVSDRTKAASNAFRISLVFGFGLSLIISFLPLTAEVLYKSQLAIFALTFALGTNLWAYLTYRYDREG